MVDPVTAPLVIEVFERYASGETVRSIVEDFNTRGLRTRKGRAFNINSFGSLLKNRKYIGEYRYQDVVIADGVPAIVPEDLFYRVQERMEKNRHAPAMSKAREDYLLTTKLFCGKCVRMMVGEGSVKSYAQICFWPLVEIYYRGRLNRPLVTFQQTGRKGSRAAVRRLPCP